MWLLLLGMTAGAVVFGILVRAAVLFTLDYYLHAYVAGKPTLLFPGFVLFDLPKEERLPPFKKILKAGDFLIRDFRDNKVKEQILRRFETKDEAKVRVVTINIEMGKQINKVIKHLKRLDPDIVFLQEVDVNTVRTSYVDTIGEIARALKMNSLFTVELVMPPEETSQYLPKGCPYDPDTMGYEGNAILTKFDFVEARGLVVPCARINKHRRKLHNEAVAVCNVPNFGMVGCYGVHLDTYGSGVTGRVQQYFDILEDVKTQRAKYEVLCKQEDKHFYQVMGGDMNTLCHGVARCLPQIACDWYSALGRVGYCEAGYFQSQAVTPGNEKYGLRLRDPFHKTNDITFHSFKGLYQGKLDWLLLSENIEPVETQICPINDRCSDHLWVMVDIQLH